MPDATPQEARSHLTLRKLRRDVPTPFRYVPEPAEVAEIKARLALSALRKVRLEGTLTPAGRADWHLVAKLGATVVQPCSVTLDPVTTRIEEPVERLFTKDFHAPREGEAEMPEDETQDPLPDVLDLAALAEETLALAIPDFPRAQMPEDETPFELRATPPGAAPLDDEESRTSPFAALEGLKRTLKE
ncbi:MAG: DUF177 domain-containing protein [Pseudomonadota bacterium]